MDSQRTPISEKCNGKCFVSYYGYQTTLEDGQTKFKWFLERGCATDTTKIPASEELMISSKNKNNPEGNSPIIATKLHKIPVYSFVCDSSPLCNSHYNPSFEKFKISGSMEVIRKCLKFSLKFKK